MTTLPRLALGTIAAAGNLGRTPTQHDAVGRTAIWAVLSALEQAGVKTQSFTSRACFSSVCGAAAITGRSCRHLDSWLMPRDVCQRMFRRGMRGADLGLLEGAFSPDELLGWHPTPHQNCGSCFETLCRWLGTPRVGILDVTRLACCKLPPRPQQVEGLILDGVDRRQLAYWQTTLESLWGLPVLGAIEALPQVRAALAATQPGDAPNATLCRLLGKSFAELSSLPQLLKLANRRFSIDSLPANEDSGFWQLAPQEAGLTIAVAYDEAFQGYFPDTLDLLEEAGATVRYFSPLSDEGALEADIVYLGCGHPERFANVLAENLTLKASLRNHLQAGKRIYAEGGGLAYLCRSLVTPDGREYPMAGLLPASAHLSPDPQPPQPVEVALSKKTWLGPAGCRLRGYLNSSWSLTASDERLGCVASDRSRFDMVARAGAVGSRVHLNFALQPEVFQSFCRRISLAGRSV